MRYFILRNGEQYGPYSKAEVQRYLRTGDIFPGDLGRSEPMDQWLPICNVLGTGAPPLPSFASVSDSAPNCKLPPHILSSAPEPPELHWAFVLLLGVLSLGLFVWIWAVVLAIWARKIDPRNQAGPLLVSALATSMVAICTFFIVPGRSEQVTLVTLLQLAAVLLFEIAVFSLRSVFMQYGKNEGALMSLNRAATLFFHVIYFQFKVNRSHHRRSTAHWLTLHHS